MDMFTELTKYTWMFAVALVGGFVGFITKISPTLHGKALKTKVKALVLGLITSMFVSYIVYEASFYFIDSERLAVALAGLAAFSGTDLLVILQQKFIETIKNKFIKA